MSDPSIRIERVVNRHQGAEFVSYPYRLHAGRDDWVPPLRRDERRRWLPRHNPALSHRHHARFLAKRNGTAVGRIAAVVDPSFLERWEAGTGFFGFFDCEDDGVVVQELFRAAEDYLRSRNLSKCLGPINLSTHDEVGVQVDGFGVPPTVLSPYNPPYYPRLLEQLGYEAGHEFHAYVMDPAHPLAPEAEAMIGSLRETTSDLGISIRSADPGEWDRDKKLLFELYNASFQSVWGFVPLRWEEYEVRADAFRPFYRPEFVAFAEKDGRAVGFALILPDVNTILRGMRGRLWPLGWIRLLRGIPRLTACRYILLGVHPDHVGKGISMLLGDLLRRNGIRMGFTRCELSLVRDGNHYVERVVRSFGGTRVKTYRLYSKSLG